MGDPSFEQIYTEAGADLGRIPWARLEPHPKMRAWADTLDGPPGRAIVIGTGLGDDAEELARRGFVTTAFDISPTAVRLARERFPGSSVDYRIADVFELPSGWRRRYDAIVEIRTLQSLPPGTRERAATAIADLLAPGGQLFVLCYGREDDLMPPRRPWPVTNAELATFTQDAGLAQLSRLDEPLNDRGDRTWTIVYARRDA